MTPQAVVFDIGRVLIDWQPEAFYDRMIGPARRERLFAEVDLHGMNLGLDRGDPWKASVQALADRHPGWAAEILFWHDRWIEMIGPDIAQSQRILRALKIRGVTVFSLTNFGAESIEVARRHHPILTQFDREFISGRLGLLKPEAGIYAAVEAQSGLPPEALFFIDDKAENVAAAAARGWQVHHFLHPEGLAARVVELGLLTEAEAA